MITDKFVPESKKAAAAINSGGLVAVMTRWGWVFAVDLQNQQASAKIMNLFDAAATAKFIHLNEAGKLFKFLQEVPEYAEEMIHYSETPLLIGFENTLNIPAELKNQMGKIRFAMLQDELLQQITYRTPKTVLLAVPLHPDLVTEAVLNNADCMVPLRQGKLHPFQYKEIYFRADNSFSIIHNEK